MSHVFLSLHISFNSQVWAAMFHVFSLYECMKLQEPSILLVLSGRPSDEDLCLALSGT